MSDLNIIKRTAEWVRFLEMAESTVQLARLNGDGWANGSPCIHFQVLEFDESNLVIGKHRCMYQYVDGGKGYLSVGNGEPVRVSAGTEGLELRCPDSQRTLAITSLRPLFDRLSSARMLLLIRLGRKGLATGGIISRSEGVFNKLLEAQL